VILPPIIQLFPSHTQQTTKKNKAQMAKRSTIESDFYFVQIEIQIAKNEEQRPSKDTLERVLGEHLLYFYGMAGTFEVHVLSYDPMRHCAILCVDRRFVYKPPFVYIHHMKCFLINVYIIYIYIYANSL